MSSLTQATSAAVDHRPARATSGTVRDRLRRRPAVVTAVIAIASAGLMVDLLLVGHTSGEELWGPVTAALGAVVGALSLAFLVHGGRSRAARYAIYALWLTVAFFGFGGYNDHRLPVPASVVDDRPRPPLAPLVFTGLGIAGALSLRSGSKED